MFSPLHRGKIMNGERVAVKRTLRDVEDINIMYREIEALTTAAGDHPYIIKYHFMVSSKLCCCL